MYVEEKNFKKEALLLNDVDGLEIVDSMEPTALLVEANDQAIMDVKSSFPLWEVREEINYPKPRID